MMWGPSGFAKGQPGGLPTIADDAPANACIDRSRRWHTAQVHIQGDYRAGLCACGQLVFCEGLVPNLWLSFPKTSDSNAPKSDVDLKWLEIGLKDVETNRTSNLLL
jgi:hypothetical protein